MVLKGVNQILFDIKMVLFVSFSNLFDIKKV